MYNFRKGYYADVRIEDRFTTMLGYNMKKMEQAIERNEKRAFIRVYNGKLWYYASVTDIDNIQNELNKLYDVAEKCDDILNNNIVKKYEVNKETIYKFKNNNVKNISIKRKQEYIEQYFDDIAFSTYTVLSRALYSDRHSDYDFYSSLGADIHYDMQTCGIMLISNLSKGEKKQNAYFTIGKTDFNELGDYHKNILDEVAVAEDSLLNSVPCEQGEFPVIFSPEVTGVFAHESFGHKSESDFMVGDESMKKEWTIGKKIASEKLSIIDTGTIDGSGYVPFDDEGTKAKVNYLIKNGVLAGRLHSALTAAELDENLTGNARAMNCLFEPIVRMTTTYVDKGDETFEGLVSKIKFGYYIKSFKHGSGMSMFTIAPDIAYEIKDGKITRPVNISVVTGNVFETLGLVDGLSQEIKIPIKILGGCGKMEQYPLNVGFGGPYMSISKMTVR